MPRLRADMTNSVLGCFHCGPEAEQHSFTTAMSCPVGCHAGQAASLSSVIGRSSAPSAPIVQIPAGPLAPAASRWNAISFPSGDYDRCCACSG
jgi:hypothetical protein